MCTCVQKDHTHTSNILQFLSEFSGLEEQQNIPACTGKKASSLQSIEAEHYTEVRKDGIIPNKSHEEKKHIVCFFNLAHFSLVGRRIFHSCNLTDFSTADISFSSQ